MKSVNVHTFRPIKVIVNSQSGQNRWGQIKCAATGQVLHTGQLKYVQATARKRYNTKVTF